MRPEVRLLSSAFAILCGGFGPVFGLEAGRQEAKSGLPGKPAAVSRTEPEAKDPKHEYGELAQATVERIQRFELEHAKLLRQERRKDGILVTFAVPQPDPKQIDAFFAPLKRFALEPRSGPVQHLIQQSLKTIPRSYGFSEGSLRAVYFFIPDAPGESIGGGSFPAATEKECDAIVLREVAPPKREPGVPFQAGEGSRYSVREAYPHWRFSLLTGHPAIREDLGKAIRKGVEIRRAR